MKKIISIIVISFLIISGFGVSGANITTKNSSLIDSTHENNLVFTLGFPNIDELRFLNKNGFQRIEIDSFSFLMDIGKPLLPAKNFIFALPPNARVRSVDFQFDKLTQLSGFYNIEPAPIIIPIDDTQNLYENVQEEWKKNNQVTYNSDQVYPSENGKITSTGTFRKYPYVSLSVCPFQYFPLTGILKYYESVKVIISYDLSESNDIFKGLGELSGPGILASFMMLILAFLTHRTKK